MPQSYVKRILDARIYDVAVETPLDRARLMSARLNNQVLLKREDLQPVFSFKIRGAYNKLRLLSEEQRQNGVIAASAGNHAQGLALSAQEMGVKATIVMPRTTPAIKVDAVRARGARVVLHGDTYDEASAHAQALVGEKGLTYIHPYDDPDVIAGQGTVALEVLRQHPGQIDAVFVPVGGGGLCAGMAAYIKYVRPETKVFAVEPEDAACLKAALDKKRRVTLPHVGIFADGVAVAQIGKETYRVLKDTVDGVITANTDEMCAAIKDIFEDTRSITEPAGALALAGLKKYVEENGCEGQTLVAVASGANTNFDRLRYISERTEIGEKREAILAVTIAEKAGSYKKFCKDLGKRNITEFNYRFADEHEARIFVGVQVSPDHNDRREMVQELRDKGYQVVDMTDNEAAKLHIRHMVGGHAPLVDNEQVLRFEFPERPGALFNFLAKLAGRWNISMFHYRNHGSAYGRVLVGMQVPKAERREMKQFLDDLGYGYWDETENEAYQFFLG
ncbi:threonine ammonia-lyase, biosynthetic [Pseudomaricurvus alkylphenolicus]|jgi:threonine dehydratase|uniref:threonine ammonia-lyase, biosynthetic n=1 Tax=Pseudomaricurvus alkylphenolicus TaxID=1306991 RepID=UPI0014241000|nr:threonine ammonia-lyase, biosynthetic [Pseudomaricurvus alkylphenolicus]NIB42735.1 threonine ammonia-lyase, biosynthetic [Pseudomaricurvus alkylphenolicus]